MRIIGNILWLILGGLLVSLGYFIAGLLYCVTIIGIPFGYQLWKFGVFSLWPFGTEVVDGDNAGGCLSIFMNVLWILLGGGRSPRRTSSSVLSAASPSSASLSVSSTSRWLSSRSPHSARPSEMVSRPRSAGLRVG